MTRGTDVIDFIEEFCRVPEGALVGQKIKLAEFQKKFIIDVYDNPHGPTHTGILSIARKNAKTATIACIMIAHICGPEAQLNSQIISGAMSRDQAALVYKLAKKILLLDERLEASTRTVDSTKTIFGLSKNVEYRAISADAQTAHGLSPVLAILDEMGQVRGATSGFIEAVTTSQGAHDDPLLILISTQSPSDADYLSLQIDDAIRGDDKGIVCHLYAADPDSDLLDRSQWGKANPALGLFRSEKDLEKQLKKASRLTTLEASSRNLLLNQRVSLENLWLAPGVWKANNAKPSIEVFKNNPVSLGIDLSQKSDLTAAVLAAEDDESGHVHIIPFVFTPLKGIEERQLRDRVPYQQWVRDGFMFTAGYNVVDYEVMCRHILEFQKEYGIELSTIEYDRWRIEVLERDSADVDFGLEATWNPVGQGYKDISPRMEKFEELLLEGKIHHGAHPLLQMAASNAIAVQDPAGSKKMDKAKSTQRIDPLVAAVMAVYAVATTEHSEFDAMMMIG